ncbi:MAG: NADH-quinone oxidoreductase subunit J [Chloroflexi bacterium]|nr:NADH-quinone oxidoreductase subunit J [Chloroflexota bacterium]
MTEARGEIFDIGYQHYDGPRNGRLHAVWSLWMNGFRTTLGLGRGTLAKLLPFGMLIATVAPAVGVVLLATIFGPEEDIIPSHEDYYGLISILLLLFSAIVAPELIIPDRRSGVINLYLVRPITAIDYVAARWASFLGLSLILVYSGQVLLLIGFLLTAGDPVDYLRDNWLDIPKFLAAGALVALFVTTIPLAVSSFTTRRTYAAAVVIAVFVISVPVAGMLTSSDCEFSERTTSEGANVQTSRCEYVTGDAAKWFALLDVGRAPIILSNMIFDAEGTGDPVWRLIDAHHPSIPILWYALLVLGPGALLFLRYRRMTI